MKIHTSSYEGLFCSDYFYNFFALGVDILFDIQTHLIKKFILHTNFPSHYEFNQYVKCNFRITIDDQLRALVNSTTIPQQNSNPPGSSNSNSEISQRGTTPSHVITPDTKWPDIQRLLGPCGKPVIHNRGSNANPFGPTLFYGYKGIIFEVMQNQHIASVCLFPLPQQQQPSSQ